MINWGENMVDIRGETRVERRGYVAFIFFRKCTIAPK